MNAEKQRIAIAEACGWEVMHPEQMMGFSSPTPECQESLLPDYLNDLNAMHEAEKVLNANQRVAYACRLTEPVRDEIYNVIPHDLDYHVCFPALHTTASQRAEAFLRTIGKWEEQET